MKRPWRVEYEDAEGRIRVATTRATQQTAREQVELLAQANPGIAYWVKKHVDFEATS